MGAPKVMYDAVTVSNIPRNAPAVAGYTAGSFPTFPELEREFPKAHKLSIAVASRFDADCLDVEPGDSTPALAPGWVKRQQARGVERPVVYASVSAMPSVLSALAHAGIPRSSVRLWTAHYTHVPHLCGPQCGFGLGTTADATQWTDKALGRSLDESLLNATFFATTPKPKPADSQKVKRWRDRLRYAQGILRVQGLEDQYPALHKELSAYAAQLREDIRKAGKR